VPGVPLTSFLQEMLLIFAFCGGGPTTRLPFPFYMFLGLSTPFLKHQRRAPLPRLGRLPCAHFPPQTLFQFLVIEDGFVNSPTIFFPCTVDDSVASVPNRARFSYGRIAPLFFPLGNFLSDCMGLISQRKIGVVDQQGGCFLAGRASLFAVLVAVFAVEMNFCRPLPAALLSRKSFFVGLFSGLASSRRRLCPSGRCASEELP